MKNPPERIESLLAGMRRAPVPEGLKERLLRTVEMRRSRERVMTPALWRAAAASLVLAILVSAADLLLAQKEQVVLAAIDGSPADGRSSAESADPARDQVLAEVLTSGELRLLSELSGIALRHRMPGSTDWTERLSLGLDLPKEGRDGA